MAEPTNQDALTALKAVLTLFPANLHPNGPAVRTRYVPQELVERWRKVAAEAAPDDHDCGD